MLSHGVPHYLSLGFQAWPHSPMRVPTVTQACTLATTWMQPAGQAWGGELQGGGRGLLKEVAAQACGMHAIWPVTLIRAACQTACVRFFAGWSTCGCTAPDARSL